MSEETPEQQIVTLTQEQQNRKLVVPFFTTVGANAQITNVASKISHHYRVTKIEIHFRDDTANNLQVRVYASDSSDAPTTNPPTGTNIIGKFSSTPYVVGQGQTIVIDCNYIPTFYETWLKVHLANTNAYALTSMVLVTIESITAKEAQELITESQFDIRIKDPEEYLLELNNKGEALFNQLTDVMSGSPPWLRGKQLEDAMSKFQEATLDFQGADRLANPFNWVNTGDNDEEKIEKFKVWWGKAGELVNAYMLGSFKISIPSLGSISAPDIGIDYDVMKWQVPSNMGKVSNLSFDTAWMPTLERAALKTWLPSRPQISDLINMRVKEVLTEGEFRDHMKEKGFNEYFSALYWDAHFIQPDFSTVREAYWRKGIPANEIEHYLALVDLDPRYNDVVWKTLLEQIPNYTDLINMRVKEVITQEQFEEALNFHGYFGEWSQRLWDAHFQPANFNDFLTAFRRKQSVNIPKAEGTPEAYTFGENTASDIEKIKELSILADYDSRYWDFFKTRIYNDPTPRQARWGYEAGVLNEQQVYDICLKNGFAPSDASWFANFSMSFQERPFITKYLTALQTAYIENVIDADELTSRVEAIPRRKEIAEWIVKIADVKKEIDASKKIKVSKVTLSDLKTLYARGNKTDYDVIEWYKAKGYSDVDAIIMGQIFKETPETEEPEKTLSVSELKQMYLMSIIGEDEFRTRMQLRGFQVVDVDNLINLYARIREEKESGGQKRALSVSEMFNAFKFWQISEDELRTNLMTRGLTLSEANLLIETNKKKWKTSSGGWSETEPLQEGD